MKPSRAFGVLFFKGGFVGFFVGVFIRNRGKRESSLFFFFLSNVDLCLQVRAIKFVSPLRRLLLVACQYVGEYIFGSFFTDLYNGEK